MKIRPVAAELFHAGGRTDMTKLTVAFRNFANAPKNCITDELHRLFIALKTFAIGKYTPLLKSLPAHEASPDATL